MPPAADQPIAHPTPAQAFKLAANHAALLRHLYNHPEYKYLSPPTARIYKTDFDNTAPALIFVSDFVETTYISCVIPFLPARATRKCRDIANPWAYADPAHEWEWVWDAGSGELKDREGKVVPFPRLGGVDAKDKMGDMHLRSFMVQKLILENGTDPKARLMVGGKVFDFGQDAKDVAATVELW
jgi:hypothetical protein